MKKTAHGIYHQGEYYIQASTLMLEKYSILRGLTFLVADRRGNFPSGFPKSEMGLFHQGTRYLQVLEEFLGKAPLFMLNLSKSEDRNHLLVELANPDFHDHHGKKVYRNSFALRKHIQIDEGKLHIRYQFRSFLANQLVFPFSIHIQNDFRDIFEVRGMERSTHGRLLPTQTRKKGILFQYQGDDHVKRFTHMQFSDRPHHLDAHHATFLLTLPPRTEVSLDLLVTCHTKQRPAPTHTLPKLRRAISSEFKQFQQAGARYFTSNETFNDLINCSLGDLWSLLEIQHGERYPLAGIPWFGAPFGRDGLITAYESLSLDPTIARDTLLFLAKRQGKKYDRFTEEEPGKILHELREGEMATLKEIPFIPYYGSVDATLLFLMVLEKYVRWTGDLPLLRKLWQSVERALAWAETDGDPDGDGFIEYHQQSPMGLAQQGWKDSHDSIVHRDGTLAQSPIALVEVQAYLYAARLGVAELATFMGKTEMAKEQRQRAGLLKKRFHQAFWDPKRNFLALALDRDKKPCRVISSNPGHALWAGIVEPGKAKRMSERMMQKDLMSGWGIRTLSKQEKTYNPLGYHRGCIWPHDNAIFLEGLRIAGNNAALKKLATALFETSTHFPTQGLPEVYCGFDRHPQHGPAPYPVACSPQAWSAAAVFLMIKAMMGVTVEGISKQLIFHQPVLPDWLEWIEVKNFPVGRDRVDFRIAKGEIETTVDILGKPHGWEILIVK